MRVFAVAVVLSVMLSAAPTYAQAPAPARPAAPAGQGQTRPAAPAGQTPAPAPRPAVPGPATPAPQQPAAPPAPNVPFPSGVRYAIIDFQRVENESSVGKAAATRLTALNQQKVNELQEKNKQLQATQQKLDQGGSVLNDAARAQMATDIDKQQRDIQRFTEDAQQELQNLQNQLENDIVTKLRPVIQKVAQDNQLHFILSGQGLVWADPAIDLTDEVIKAFDATK